MFDNQPQQFDQWRTHIPNHKLFSQSILCSKNGEGCRPSKRLIKNIHRTWEELADFRSKFPLAPLIRDYVWNSCHFKWFGLQLSVIPPTAIPLGNRRISPPFREAIQP